MGTSTSKYPGQRGTNGIGGTSTASMPTSPNSNSLSRNNRRPSFNSLRRGTSPSTSSATIQQPSTTNTYPTQRQSPPSSSLPPISPNRVHSGPGAFSVDPSTAPGAIFRVTIPPNVRPGDDFQVHAGNRVVRVRCPPNARPNQAIQITVPPEPTITRRDDGGLPAGLTGGGGDQQHSPGVTPIPNSDGGPPAYMVRVPAGVVPGQQFHVLVAGHQLMVTCPPQVRENMSVRIVLPGSDPNDTNGQSASTIQRGTNVDRPPQQGSLMGRPPQRGALRTNPSVAGRGPQQPPRSAPPSRPNTQLFEVVVPQGARPGQPFALLAGGQRVLVTCPANAVPGQKIRFELPVALTQPSNDGEENKNSLLVKLSYDKDGWTRTIRLSDMKFQWVRMDTQGDVDLNKRFDPKTAAYARRLAFLEGGDPRLRRGEISLVPATEVSVESFVLKNDGHHLVSCADITNAQRMNFDDKVTWFHKACSELCVEWSEGHMRLNVRREHLLHDSITGVMSMQAADLRKLWRFEFLEEQGIDAGGLAREWFQLISEACFNPDNGLWQYSASNQMSMQINPCSEIACPEDHLLYFRFLGRVMGKALFDRQIISGHMVRHLYKHLLGWPVMFDDLKVVDEEYYNNLNKILDYTEEELEMVCLDFTTTETTMGAVEEIELCDGGADIEVTKDNLPEYMECCLKYRLLGRVKNQLNELLLGFYDVIPEPLLTPFDFQEIELLMCGLPNIDIDDWKANTLYSGCYESSEGRHSVCQWFWEVVENEFDDELKARLLQFVTGTSGVPARGFSVLQGNDGNIRKFTIHGVAIENCLFPRAHTCFNRIDLPMYVSKKDLEEKLKLAVQMEVTGFDFE